MHGTRIRFGHACMHTNVQKSLREMLTDKECGPEKKQGKTPPGEKTCWQRPAWKLDILSTCCRKIHFACAFYTDFFAGSKHLVPSLFSPLSSDFGHWQLEV